MLVVARGEICTFFNLLSHFIRLFFVSGNVRGCLHGRRKILELGRSYKADHASAICFPYLVYMQKVVHGSSARILLAERQEDPSTM